MIEIPLYIFLLIYILIVLGTVLFFLFDLYHIIASGELSFVSFSVTAIIGAIMMGVILYTWYALSGVGIDWMAPFSLNDSTPSFESFDSF